MFKAGEGINVTVINGKLDDEEKQGLDVMMNLLDNPAMDAEQLKSMGYEKITIDGKEGMKTSNINGDVHTMVVFAKTNDGMFYLQLIGTAATKENSEKQIKELLNTVKFS